MSSSKTLHQPLRINSLLKFDHYSLLYKPSIFPNPDFTIYQFGTSDEANEFLFGIESSLKNAVELFDLNHFPVKFSLFRNNAEFYTYYLHLEKLASDQPEQLSLNYYNYSYDTLMSSTDQTIIVPKFNEESYYGLDSLKSYLHQSNRIVHPTYRNYRTYKACYHPSLVNGFPIDTLNKGYDMETFLEFIKNTCEDPSSGGILLLNLDEFGPDLKAEQLQSLREILPYHQFLFTATPPLYKKITDHLDEIDLSIKDFPANDLPESSSTPETHIEIPSNTKYYSSPINSAEPPCTESETTTSSPFNEHSSTAPETSDSSASADPSPKPFTPSQSNLDSINIPQETKEDAVQILDQLGLSLHSAVNAFLKQVIYQKKIPFDIKL